MASPGPPSTDPLPPPPQATPSFWAPPAGESVIGEKLGRVISPGFQRIIPNYHFLADQVDTDEITDYLIACEVVDLPHGRDFIDHGGPDGTRKAKFRRLMTLMCDKDISSDIPVWEKFIEALDKADCKHCVAMIQDTEPIAVTYDEVYRMLPPRELWYPYRGPAYSATTVTTELESAYSRLVYQSRMEIYEDSDVFVETSSYQTAQDLLQEHGLLFITGPGGCGKTALARALLRHHHHQHLGSDPLVLHSLLGPGIRCGGER